MTFTQKEKNGLPPGALFGGRGEGGGGVGAQAAIQRLPPKDVDLSVDVRTNTEVRLGREEATHRDEGHVVVGIPGGPDDDDAYEGTGDINSYSVRRQAGGGANTYLPKTITANLRARART